MKKLISILGIALMALVITSFCSCSNDDDEPKQTDVRFVAPSTAWNSDVIAVRSYMKANVAGVVEDLYDEDPEMGFDECRFVNKDKSVIYDYIFVDGKLVQSTVIYDGINNQYQSIVSQVSGKFGIADWTVQKTEYADDVRSATDSSKQTDFLIVRNDRMNYIMLYFNYTGFKWDNDSFGYID